MKKQIHDQKHFFKEWSRRTGYTQKELMEIYDELIKMIETSANSADETKTIIPQIGTINVKPEGMKKRRNPRTGQFVVVDENRKTHFHLYARFKEKFKVMKK